MEILIKTNDLQTIKSLKEEDEIKRYIVSQYAIGFGLENLIPVLLVIPANIISSLIVHKIQKILENRNKENETVVYIDNKQIININNIDEFKFIINKD